MFARTHDEIDQANGVIERIKKLSDGLIKIGPINVIGLDGLLSFIPIAGPIYSAGAGIIILSQGARARVAPQTWLAALILLLIDLGIDVTEIIPFAGLFLTVVTGGVDAAFQGHLYAAHLIQKDIARTHYVTGKRSEARKSGAHAEHMATMKATKGKSRVVYLG